MKTFHLLYMYIPMKIFISKCHHIYVHAKQQFLLITSFLVQKCIRAVRFEPLKEIRVNPVRIIKLLINMVYY